MAFTGTVFNTKKPFFRFEINEIIFNKPLNNKQQNTNMRSYRTTQLLVNVKFTDAGLMNL